MDLFLSTFLSLVEPRMFLSLCAGIVAGVVGGAIPGITITMTIILTLPFTFGMPSLQGLATMIGVYVGGSAGGLISACLLGIPGTPSAIATTFDGFPMARKGEPGRAVWLGIWASCIGGLLAGIPLIVGATQLAYLALNFGPWEYFSLFILTLSIVASLSEQSLVKGLIASAFGLLITSIGTDPMMAIPRLTFGSDFLRTGFPFLPILIGVFGLSQIMSDLEKSDTTKDGAGLGRNIHMKVSHPAIIREIFAQPVNLIRSTLIGLWIGILPAVGGSAANILAYDQAKKGSKHPEKFGTGIAEGIIASESSNNANVGGSLITMMAFGIPGDAVTAVMLGALIIHGIQPGPMFVVTNAQIAYGMFAAYFLAHPLMVILEGLFLRFALPVVKLASVHPGPDRSGPMRHRLLCLEQHHRERLDLLHLRDLGLFDGEDGVPAGAPHPGRHPRRHDRDELHPGHDDRLRLDAVLHPAVVGRHVGARRTFLRLLSLAAASRRDTRRRAV